MSKLNQLTKLFADMDESELAKPDAVITALIAACDQEFSPEQTDEAIWKGVKNLIM